MVRESQKRESKMPRLKIPNNASIHTLKNFMDMNAPFADSSSPAVLTLNPKWAHMDPMALAMSAAWGGWCQRRGLDIKVENMSGPHTNYAARMRLFDHLQVSCDIRLEEHEEAGRFLPLQRVSTHEDLSGVIANVSALLHLDTEPDGLAAVQYCVSELIRNVLEHSGSRDGAFVCAQRYLGVPKRVSIAVADCGNGISRHLGRVYPKALNDNFTAISMAMQPGITGALSDGEYGSPDNAGAGLFITRAIAKATGGYFVLLSGNAVYRLRRQIKNSPRTLFSNAFDDPRGDKWQLASSWQGTVAAAEIVTEKISDFPAFFRWIRNQLPKKRRIAGKIKFT